jgi:hypothetical protein
MDETSEYISGDMLTDPDWENRRLCSDDSCIGVIGPDGRCRICGLSAPEAHTNPDLSAGNSVFMDAPLEPHSEKLEFEPQAPAWEDRKLCVDDSCIGTVGADGRCRVCGLPG